MIVDNDEADMPKRMAFLHKVFKGDPTDPALKLTKEDCRMLQNIKVIHKSKRSLDSKKEMEERLTTHIVKSLHEI